jgi:hypothetical protein
MAEKRPKFVPDPTTPSFQFETPEWRKAVAGALLQYARLIRLGELHAVQLFAELNTWRNILADELDMEAIEDAESLTTMVHPRARVVPDDPSYR